MIAQERLKKILNYDPETGIFRWIDAKNQSQLNGEIAGSPDTRGWIYIGIEGKKYAAHRLAWLYVYGERPEIDIDHKNRCRSDNRIDNLRLATKNQNQHNQGISRANKTGFKGVCIHRPSGKYQSQIKHFGKKIYLGLFSSPEDASRAYEMAALKLFGEFSYNTKGNHHGAQKCCHHHIQGRPRSG